MTEETRIAIPAFPNNRYDAVQLVEGFLHLTQKDWRSLVTVLYKAREAWLAFSLEGVFVELGKETDKLKLRVEVLSGSARKSRSWRYTMEELTGVFSLLRNDRYACLDSVGTMLMFRHADYRCFLRILSKCSMGSVTFRIGNTHVRFSRCAEEQEEIHICLETRRGRKLLEHCFLFQLKDIV